MPIRAEQESLSPCRLQLQSVPARPPSYHSILQSQLQLMHTKQNPIRPHFRLDMQKLLDIQWTSLRAMHAQGYKWAQFLRIRRVQWSGQHPQLEQSAALATYIVFGGLPEYLGHQQH